MNTLPPLNGLRAFEAAARHLSLTKAAEELHVTPGAVSQQVRSLEDFLGVQLFRRLNRRLLLTDAGQTLLPKLSQGFGQIGEAVDAVRRIDVHKPLTVSVAPSFGSKWLVPRLADFQNRYPEIDVRIDASPNLVDFRHDDIDIGIRFGQGDYPGLQSDCLLSQEVFPVCSSKLLQRKHPLKCPEDLAWHTLLHYDFASPDPAWPDWDMWLRAAGVSDKVDSNRGPRFTTHEMLLSAVELAQGVALIGSVTAADDLASGKLIRPFDLSFPLDFSYYIVYLESRAENNRIKVFRDWLLEQAEKTPF